MKKSLSTTELSSESKQIDHEVKTVHKQIALAEKSLANLIKDFTNISVDLDRLYSRQEDLCSSLSNIASEESPVLKDSFVAISEHIRIILQSLHIHVGVLQEHVLNPMSENAKKCKEARTVLEKCSDAKKQRAFAIKALNKSKKTKSRNLNFDENMQHKAVLETTKQLNELTSQMVVFEKSKAEDLQKLLKVYLHSSLAYHVKAVEQYTKAYQSLTLVDADKHVGHFIQNLQFSEKDARGDFVRWHSFNSLHSNK